MHEERSKPEANSEKAERAIEFHIVEIHFLVNEKKALSRLSL